MTDTDLHSGMIIAILVCVLALIVNAIAVIILIVLCRRRRSQRVTTMGVLETEPVYHVAGDVRDLNTENCEEYLDDKGYEIPVLPPYTYMTPLPGNSQIDYQNDAGAAWRGNLGPYELEVRPDVPTDSFRDGKGDHTDQISGKRSAASVKPSVKLTLALYHTPNS